MPHHHVVKLEIVIIIKKSWGIFNLFKVYYYDFKINNISIQKNPLIVILTIGIHKPTQAKATIIMGITTFKKILILKDFNNMT